MSAICLCRYGKTLSISSGLAQLLTRLINRCLHYNIADVNILARFNLIAISMLSSSLPAAPQTAPVHLRPHRPSPTNSQLAFSSPTPNTVCVQPARSLHRTVAHHRFQFGQRARQSSFAALVWSISTLASVSVTFNRLNSSRHRLTPPRRCHSGYRLSSRRQLFSITINIPSEWHLPPIISA